MNRRDLWWLRRQLRKTRSREFYLERINCPLLAREVRAAADRIERRIAEIESR